MVRSIVLGLDLGRIIAGSPKHPCDVVPFSVVDEIVGSKDPVCRGWTADGCLTYLLVTSGLDVLTS